MSTLGHTCPIGHRSHNFSLQYMLPSKNARCPKNIGDTPYLSAISLVFLLTSFSPASIGTNPHMLKSVNNGPRNRYVKRGISTLITPASLISNKIGRNSATDPLKSSNFLQENFHLSATCRSLSIEAYQILHNLF